MNFTDIFFKILNLKFRKNCLHVCVGQHRIKAIHIESFHYSSSNWLRFDKDGWLKNDKIFDRCHRKVGVTQGALMGPKTLH